MAKDKKLKSVNKEEISNIDEIEEKNGADEKTSNVVLKPPSEKDVENLEKLENSGSSRLQIILSFIKRTGVGIGADLTHYDFPSSFLLPYSTHEYYSNNLANEFDILLRANIDDEVERLLEVFKYDLALKPIIEDPTRSPLRALSGETKSSNFHLTLIDGDKSEIIVTDNYYIVETIDEQKAFTASCIYNKREGVKVHFNNESKMFFNGTHIKLPIIGNTIVRFEKFNEEYTITNPNIYARYLRGFVEYYGESTITGKNSKFYIIKTNHPKPLFGGSVNVVEAKLFYADDPNPLYKMNGIWSKEIEITNCKTKETKLFYKKPSKYLTKIIPEILPTDSSIVWKDIILPTSNGEKINISKEKSKIIEKQKKLKWGISQFHLNQDSNIWEPINYKD
ncbi:hypothetical protein RB653_006824 [Dictyostelium firmibasis]|uniref:Uncharacterized protein n=1 Tax=Dictyostelium firmibasis TaxID=79012 RepID=A0AAN7YQK9_9MYCE